MIFNKLKSFPINWENGMKLTSDHFKHLEESIEDNVRDVRALALNSNACYGLIPNSEFSLQNAQGQSPQSVRVILNACRAILPGGYRVEIVPENIQKLQIPNELPFVEFLPTQGTRYHIFLTVDETKMVPSGIPETRPIRQPHVCHDYRIECVPSEKLKTVQKISASRMKIAEWKDGKIIDAYIPPSLTLCGFPLLEKWYQFFQNQLENIVRISTHVINEQRKKDPARTEFCLVIVHHLRGSRAHYKWVLPNQSPTQLIVYLADFASLVEGLIETCDRDFVRNVLKNGQVNDLRPNIMELMKPNEIHHENMANQIVSMKKFMDSLISTLQTLVTSKPPKPRMGERNISAG